MLNTLICECGNEDINEFSMKACLSKSYFITDETNDTLYLSLEGNDLDEDDVPECICLVCGAEVEVPKNIEYV